VVQSVFGRPDADIEKILRGLREAFFPSAEESPPVHGPKPVATERIADLARQEEISFGAHSVNHPFFFTLSSEEIRREMVDSRREVEEMTGRPVDHFCYPYGSLRAIGSQAPDIARELFQSATTAMGTRCRPGLNPALLPRITMHEHYTPGMTSLKVKAAR
jgi:peptidoglycan/xylan/chitin deacetylase (PgdA/CDA1 family)